MATTVKSPSRGRRTRSANDRLGRSRIGGFRTIEFERDESVARITLDRPEVLNAYNTEMRDDFHAALSMVRDDASIRALVLRGNGKAFSSGGDVREFGSAPSPVAAREIRLARDVWKLLVSLDAWTIAAIHGHAAGSGLEMALLCDFRIAAEGSLLLLPETGLGMIPGVVGTQTVPRIVREGHALDILLTGRRIDARLAERLGMVGSVVPGDRLRREADRLAGRLANIEGKLSAAAKRLVMRGLDLPLDAALAVERATARRFVPGPRGNEP
jgi:enoyl-CoA hydratase/carnithine racemase